MQTWLVFATLLLKAYTEETLKHATKSDSSTWRMTQTWASCFCNSESLGMETLMQVLLRQRVCVRVQGRLYIYNIGK